MESENTQSYKDLLKCISTWPKDDGYDNLITYVASVLNDLKMIKNEQLVELSFGKSKLSRDVLQSLRKNSIFWKECWFSSNRNYVFCFEVI